MPGETESDDAVYGSILRSQDAWNAEGAGGDEVGAFHRTVLEQHSARIRRCHDYLNPTRPPGRRRPGRAGVAVRFRLLARYTVTVSSSGLCIA
ncbi:hypothetical protein [Kitasatospora camelliae]|uniref:Uncharacterized protein n=1 Tax=Kitasatospora camelliae TaxID=3156397 RepID=A0AAU8JR13_9ACTN